MLHALILSCFV